MIRMTGSMIRLPLVALALAGLLASLPARADPMRCGDELKACTAACSKPTDRRQTSSCVSDCQARMASCRMTGCWDNGTSRYCGLLRQ
jgi:hypothetical protein